MTPPAFGKENAGDGEMDGAHTSKELTVHPRVHRILQALGAGPKRSIDLAEELGMSRVTLSRVLRDLKSLSVIEDTHPHADKRFRMYKLRGRAVPQTSEEDKPAPTQARVDSEGIEPLDDISCEFSMLSVMSGLDVGDEIGPPFRSEFDETALQAPAPYLLPKVGPGADAHRRQEAGGFTDVGELALSPLAIILKRLDGWSTLQSSDMVKLLELVGQPVRHRTGADLGDDSDDSCRILISGWASRRRTASTGKAAIFDFVVPGDCIGLSMRSRPSGLYRVKALQSGLSADATRLRDWLRSEKASGSDLVRASLEYEHAETRRLVDHVWSLSTRTSYQAAADLFANLHDRLIKVGLAGHGEMQMPLTQGVLAEALGISAMQMNRVLSTLRRDGVIDLRGGKATYRDVGRLREAADSYS